MLLAKMSLISKSDNLVPLKDSEQRKLDLVAMHQHMLFKQLRSNQPSASPEDIMNRPEVERPERSTRAKIQRGNEESSDMPTAGKVQWKKKAEELQYRIELLEEENALLKQQLEQRPSAEQGDTEDKADTEPESSTDASSNSSTDSDSSSSSSSSSDGRKKKRKHKKSKAKEYRVATISDVVKRYRQILRIIQRGHKMSRAFFKAGVTRNAVKDTAAIAELYIADRSVLEGIKGKKTLIHLAKVCETKIVGELALKIEELKIKKKLIPFTKRV